MCVCLFTGLLVCVCVCLSRFSLFSPHLIERSRLFVSWCSSLCSLLVAPQEACRSHYSQKKCYSAIHPQFFQSIPLTLKPKEFLRERRKYEILRLFSCRCGVILSRIFSINRCKNGFSLTCFRVKENRTLCSQLRTQNCASSETLRCGSEVTFHLN